MGLDRFPWWGYLLAASFVAGLGVSIVATYNGALRTADHATAAVAAAQTETHQAQGQTQLNGAAVVVGDAQAAQEHHAAETVAHARAQVAAIDPEDPHALDALYGVYLAGACRLRDSSDAYHGHALDAYGARVGDPTGDAPAPPHKGPACATDAGPAGEPGAGLGKLR